MNCKYHSTHEAQAICEKCRNPVCEECTIKVDDRTICRHCIQQNLFSDPQALENKPLWERFLFFICSLIPGAAHMHMGLFRRGLQLMVIAFGVIFVSGYADLIIFIPTAFIPIWFFSFFESHNLKKQMWKGQQLEDRDLFDRHVFNYAPLLQNRRLIGIAVIVIGVFGFMRVIEVEAFGGYRYIIRNTLHLVRSSFIPALLILGGIYLLRKAKQKPETGEELSMGTDCQ